MDNNENVIFLYSNHSVRCKYILENIFKYNFNFIKTICIDKVEIRSRVLKSQLNIKQVPCIIIVDNGLEILDSEKSILFINTMVHRIENLKAKTEIHSPVELNKPSQEEPKQTENKKSLTLIDDLLGEIDETKQKTKEIENERIKNDISKKPDFNIESNFAGELVMKSINSEKKVDISSMAKKMEESRNEELKIK